MCHGPRKRAIQAKQALAGSMIALRAPTAADWDTIGQVADASLAGVAGVPSQGEWLRNRKDYGAQRGTRYHQVADLDGVVVGYASAEEEATPAGAGFRLFVVTAPQSRAAVGDRLLAWLKSQLAQEGACPAWFVEFSNDVSFVRYLEGKGFRPVRQFEWQGQDLVVLASDAFSGMGDG